MANQVGSVLQSLPISDLIAIPLISACTAQNALSGTTADFINNVGFTKHTDASGNITSVTVNTTEFTYDDGLDTKHLKVPLLSVVNVPSLAIQEIDVDFDITVNGMSYNNSNTSNTVNGNNSNYNINNIFNSNTVNANSNFNNYSTSATLSTSSNNVTNAQAKYTIHVKASNQPTTGLSRIIDILSNTITSYSVTTTNN